MTRQIASGTLGAAGQLLATDADDWDWRLSIADLESEGGGSAFDGMPRILTVVEGEVLAITVEGPSSNWRSSGHCASMAGRLPAQGCPPGRSAT